MSNAPLPSKITSVDPAQNRVEPQNANGIDILEPSDDEIIALDDSLSQEIAKAQTFAEKHAQDPLVDPRGLLTYQMEFALTVTLKYALERAGGDFKALDASGQQALGIITQHNLRLVSFVTRRYTGRGVLEEDLQQEGMIGLLLALKRFDPFRGYKFSTYAYWWIRQYILRVITDHSRTIRLPAHSIDLMNRATTVGQQLAAQLGRVPTTLELAAALNTTVDSLRAVYDAAPTPLSLDLPHNEDDDESPLDIEGGLSNPEALMTLAESKTEVFQVMLEFLNPREATILKLRLGMHPHSDGEMMTLEEVGSQIGLTRERIRQIEEKALKKLRAPYVRQRLKTFLESD